MWLIHVLTKNIFLLEKTVLPNFWPLKFVVFFGLLLIKSGNTTEKVKWYSLLNFEPLVESCFNESFSFSYETASIYLSSQRLSSPKNVLLNFNFFAKFGRILSVVF